MKKIKRSYFLRFTNEPENTELTTTIAASIAVTEEALKASEQRRNLLLQILAYEKQTSELQIQSEIFEKASATDNLKLYIF